MKKEEAKNLGLKRFQLDAPCAKGHLAERYVSTGACTECMKIGFRQFYARNLEHFAAKAKRRPKNPRPIKPTTPLGRQPTAIKNFSSTPMHGPKSSEQKVS
jgi:hypothetical protein